MLKQLRRETYLFQTISDGKYTKMNKEILIENMEIYNSLHFPESTLCTSSKAKLRSTWKLIICLAFYR